LERKERIEKKLAKRHLAQLPRFFNSKVKIWCFFGGAVFVSY
jgi:hypothetical protein